MKTTLALIALLLVVASAHPLYDPTVGQVPTLLLVRQDPTVGENPTLVMVELDPAQVEDLLWNQLTVTDQELELLEDSGEEATLHERRKRQTTLSGGVNSERVGRGGRRDSAHFNIGRTTGRHTFKGGVTYDRTKVPGFGTDRNFGANVGYQFKPNRNTAFSIGAQHNRGGGGRSTSFGLGFSHTFGRK